MAQCRNEYIDLDLFEEEKVPHKVTIILSTIIGWCSLMIGIFWYLFSFVGIIKVATSGLDEGDIKLIAIFILLGFIFEQIAGKRINLYSKALKVIYYIVFVLVTFFSLMLIIDCFLGKDPFELTRILAKIIFWLINGLLLYRKKLLVNE